LVMGRQGDKETGRQGDRVTRRQGAGEIRNSQPAHSPAAVLREELARRTDDRRIVAELLEVPVEDVELGPNLVENGGFEAWKEGRLEEWDWSPMFSKSPFNKALFVGGFDEFESYDGEKAMRIDGFWIQKEKDLHPARAGYWHGAIELKPDTPYVLSFYYRTRKLREGKAAVWVFSGEPEVLFKHDHMLPRTYSSWRKFIIVGWSRKEGANKIKPLLRSWGVGGVGFEGMELREIILAADAQIEDYSTRFELR